MIVRINQFDPEWAEDAADWSAGAFTGPIRAAWPDDTHGFEILILENDESDQLLDASARRSRLRELLPDLMLALAEPGHAAVLRLDGPLTAAGLLPVLSCLDLDDPAARFGLSPAMKLGEQSPEGSIRFHAPDPATAALCVAPSVDLESAVRLRIFGVPSELVAPLLDVSTLEDERWPEIVSEASYLLQTVRGLGALHVLTRRFDPDQLRARVTHQLLRAKI